MTMRASDNGRSGTLAGGRGCRGLLFLVAFLIFVLTTFVLTSSAQTPPPTQGDWIVRDTTVVSDARVVLNGSLVVSSGGELELNDVELEIRGDAPGSQGISVDSQSQLVFNGGSIGHGNTHPFTFVIARNGGLRMDGVNITGMWHNGEVDPEDVRGGLQMFSDDVTLSNCTLSGNERVAVTVVDAAPLIQDCILERSAYHTFYKEGTLLQRDAYGVINVRGAPRVQRCMIRENGDYNTTYNDWIFYWSGCTMRVFSYGIYTIGGDLEVRDSTISETGRLANVYSVYFVDPATGRGVDISQHYQLPRASIWAVEPDSLTVEGTTFTTNYMGIGESSNQARQIHIQGGTAVVRDCLLFHNGGSGIYGEYANLTVTGCEASDNLYTALVLTGNGHYTASDIAIDGTNGTRPYESERGVGLVDLVENATLNNLTITNVEFAFQIRRCSGIEIWDGTVLEVDKALFVNAAQVDLYNVSFDRMRYDMRGDHSDIHVYDFMDIEVAWPDGRPIPDAEVRITNKEGHLVLRERMGPEGTLGPFAFPEIRIEGNYHEVNITDNRLLSAQAVMGMTRSDVLTARCVWRTHIYLIVNDNNPPCLSILTPLDDHVQASSTVIVQGVVWDLGSGVDLVEVKADDGEWSSASGTDPWSIALQLPEGVHRIEARAFDLAGGVATDSVDNVTVDRTPPTIEIIEPTAERTWTNLDLVAVRGLTEPGARVLVNGVGVTVVEGEFSTDLELNQEGAHIVVVMVTDPASNSASVTLRVVRDGTPPGLMITSPANMTETNASIVTVQGRTEEDADVTVDGEVADVDEGVFGHMVHLEEGINRVLVTATDLLGNARSEELWIVLDTLPPNVVIGYPDGDLVIRERRIEVVGTLLSDPGTMDPSDCQVIRFNGFPVTVGEEAGAFSYWLTLHEGVNELVIEAEDDVGNVATWTFTVTADTVPPLLIMTSPVNGAVINKTWCVVAGDVEAWADVTINNGSVVVADGAFVVNATLERTDLPGGMVNTIEVLAVDQAGNTASVVLEVVCDVVGPGLSLEVVADTTREEHVYINGTVDDPEDVAFVSVDGLRLECGADGSFSVLVQLVVGANTFVVRSVDHMGNEDVMELRVTLDREPPKVVREEEGPSLALIALLVALCFVLGLVVAYLTLQRGELRT